MLLHDDIGGDDVGRTRLYRVQFGIAAIRFLRVIHE